MQGATIEGCNFNGCTINNTNLTNLIGDPLNDPNNSVFNDSADMFIGENMNYNNMIVVDNDMFKLEEQQSFVELTDSVAENITWNDYNVINNYRHQYTQ